MCCGRIRVGALIGGSRRLVRHGWLKEDKSELSQRVQGRINTFFFFFFFLKHVGLGFTMLKKDNEGDEMNKLRYLDQSNMRHVGTSPKLITCLGLCWVAEDASHFPFQPLMVATLFSGSLAWWLNSHLAPSYSSLLPC